MAAELDDFDRKILTLLQANGRLTNQELADLVGLSASQCSRRRINLEQAHWIQGYHARLAPHAVGVGIMGLIEVRLVSHAPAAASSFHQRVATEPAVLDAFKTTGDYDYLLKVAVPDLPALSRLLSELVQAHESVAHVRTSIVLERIKENGAPLVTE